MPKRKAFMEKKRCEITLSSFIKDDTVEEENQSAAFGYIEISGHIYKITFSEKQEGVDIDTSIMISDSFVNMTKSGGIESTMRFKKGVITSTTYTVSGFAFDCDIMTKDIVLKKEDNGIVLKLIYELKLGGVVRETSLTLTAVY